MRVKKSLSGFQTSLDSKIFFKEILNLPEKLMDSRMYRNRKITESRSFAGWGGRTPEKIKRTQNKGKFGKQRKWNSFKRNGKNQWLEDSIY